MSPGPDKYEKVGSIVCFVIASTHRNQKVASHLLNAACKKFSQKGLEFAEAYSVKKPSSVAYTFPGPLSIYLKASFSTHRDADLVSCSTKATITDLQAFGFVGSRHLW